MRPPGSVPRSLTSRSRAAARPRVPAVFAARSNSAATSGTCRPAEAPRPRARDAQPAASRSRGETRALIASDSPRSDSSETPSDVTTTVPGCTEPCVTPAECSASSVWAVSTRTEAAPPGSTGPAASRSASVGLTACAVSSHTCSPAATTSATGISPLSPASTSRWSVMTACTTRSRTPGRPTILGSNSSAPALRPSGEMASIQLPSSVIQVCSVSRNPAIP